MLSKKFNTIDEYHSEFDAASRKLLNEMRNTIKQAAPKAEEVISYNMPAFKQDDGVLVYYAANKSHIGFYPTSSPIKVFKGELMKYKTSKGAIQFPSDEAIPKTLIKKIVKYRIKENAARQLAREMKKQKQK